MNKKIKCFISASHGANLMYIKNVLADNDVEVFDPYDFSTRESMQENIKKHMAEVDFAIFIVAEDSQNVIYEMGVCDGIGKPFFIFLEKGYKVPFYIENKMFIRTNLRDSDFLEESVVKILRNLKRDHNEIFD